jgi:hypothetical protein
LYIFCRRGTPISTDGVQGQFCEVSQLWRAGNLRMLVVADTIHGGSKVIDRVVDRQHGDS